MNTISARRLVGFIALTLIIVVGTLLLGVALGGREPAPFPTATPEVSATPPPAAPSVAPASATPSPAASATPTPTRAPGPGFSAAPRDSDTPGGGGPIPSFVPIPSGPFP